MKDYKPGHKVSTVGEDDRPDLEGKVVQYFMRSGRSFPALIVGFNTSVGITLVNANDKDHYLLCFRGPVCPGLIDFNYEYHEALTEYMTGACEAGVVKADDILKVRDKYKSFPYGSSPSAKDCAYNQ